MSSRFNAILKGASLNDSSVDGGYTYYGFSRSEKSWVIMRVNTAETEYRYSVGSAAGGTTYAQAWSARTVLKYATANAYKY